MPTERAAMQQDAYDDIDRDMIYAEEMAQGGDTSAMMEQGGGSEYTDGARGPIGPEELNEIRTQYLNQAGKFSNFAEENGMDMNRLTSMFSEEFSKEDIEMFLDPRKINTEEDAIKVGMMGDEWADYADIDAEQFFNGGEVVKCGSECQERRKGKPNPLAMNDADFVAQNPDL